MLKKSIFGLCIFFIASIIIINSASAIKIAVVPHANEVILGDSVDVNIDISGLGAFFPERPYLGAYDISLTFNPDILQIDKDSNNIINIVISEYLVNPNIPAPIIDLKEERDNTIDLFYSAVDYNTPGELSIPICLRGQPGDFTLATLTFDTLALGYSSLEITSCWVLESLGEEELSCEIINGEVTVRPIPEPSSFLLLGSLLIGLGCFKRKKVF